MLRIIFIVMLFLVSAPSFCQVKRGTYRLIHDTAALTLIDTLLGRDYASLIIHRKHAFTYESRRISSCFLWYNVKGKWENRKDTLILTDNAFGDRSPIRSTSEENGKETSMRVVDEEGKPLEHMKVMYKFHGSKDTLIANTDIQGKVTFDPPLHLGANRQTVYGFVVVDDIEFSIYECRNEKDRNIGNGFMNVGTQMQCTIIKNTDRVHGIRKTYYQIKGKELKFLFVQYDKEDFIPTREMVGSFSM